MIISSWNVNSIRARILNVQEYLKKFNPDVVLVQEIKTQDETYPYDDVKKIKYESHKNWFLKAIKKKTNFILIIKKNKINCGYLRYEKKLNFYIVSVCITKKFRNKNIALSALLIGDKKVKKNKKFKLKAIVKKNNFPSIKLFFKAGYFLQKKEKNLIFFEK